MLQYLIHDNTCMQMTWSGLIVTKPKVTSVKMGFNHDITTVINYLHNWRLKLHKPEASVLCFHLNIHQAYV